MMNESIKEPQSAKERVDLARKLYKEWAKIRDAKDQANWLEGRIIYFFEKYGLHNHLFGKSISKAAFYAEIDIPYSTARFRESIYRFYVIEHGFTFEELKNANTKKLFRALPYIRDKSKKQIKDVIELAEREKQSFGDFMITMGAPENKCDHREKDEVHKCKQCGKITA